MALYAHVKQLLKCYSFQIEDPVKKTQCVTWFVETKSDTQTQRSYQTKYGEKPLFRSSIRDWYEKFMTTESVNYKGRSGRPSTSEENVEWACKAFSKSPVKSIWNASQELNFLKIAMHRVLHKWLQLWTYKFQIVKA